MVKIRYLFTAFLAAALAGCSDSDAPSGVTPSGPGQTAVRGSTPVGFSAYASRGTTRAGFAGALGMDQLVKSQVEKGGFGVFAYYTDLRRYDQTYVPNFMYNQGVFKGDGTVWAYSPVMYWPNESGSGAESDDEDKVSFFAYAPYVQHASAAAGSVDTSADPTAAEWGITGFSRNTAAGDPLVRYVTSFDPGRSVDLCWGVCDETSWNKIQNSTAPQTMAKGLPWLDVEHPQGTDQRMTFTFKHALSQFNVQIDADGDAVSHDAGKDVDAGTRIYVRSISFTGIALKGALNLNNTVGGDNPQALWLDYAGVTDLPFGESVTVKDGRRDGREGASGAEAANETPSGLNDKIIQKDGADKGFTQPGVTHTAVNLFNSTALDKCVYVIPTGEKMTVTIVYDVETRNPLLPTYISDGATNGVSVENKVSQDILFGTDPSKGLENGKKYTLKLHLGMNTVKFSADVTAWDDADAVSGSGWLPSNLATDTPVGLNLGTSLTMSLSGAGSQTITATTKPAGDDVYWSNSNDGVATIAGVTAPARAGTRGGAQAGEIGPYQSVVITPHAVGTTIVTARTEHGSAQCVVTVTDVNTPDVAITLNKSEITLYAGGGTETLVATTTPGGETVTWVSSNTAAATVDQNGKVVGAGTGLTYITATSPSGKSATCTVTVMPSQLSLNKTSLPLTVGNDETLSATLTPDDGRTVTWTTSDDAVATVNASGTVHAVAVGTAKITATIPGGGTATCTVTVTGSKATVTTAPAARSLTYSGSAQALVTSGTAQNGTMNYSLGTASAPGSWSSSVPAVTDAGTYYVWYKAAGTGGYLDSDAAGPVTVTVAKKSATISFGTAEVSKEAGEGDYTQTATITGGGTVAYSISNTGGSEATVNDSSGKVSLGNKAGTATVTATVTPDKNHSYASTMASYVITILPSAAVTASPDVDNWHGSGDVDLDGDPGI